jgi:hypothetical protein
MLNVKGISKQRIDARGHYDLRVEIILQTYNYPGKSHKK